MNQAYYERNAIKANDRILSLKQIDDKAPIGSTGLVDKKLFTGENKLHAFMDETCLWALRYDSGILPEPLRQKFTSFNILYNFVEEYFRKRNIKIEQVHD